MNLYFLRARCIILCFINVLHFVGSLYPRIAQFCSGDIPCEECGICRKDASGIEFCDKSFFVTPGNDTHDIFTQECKPRNMCSPQSCTNSVSCKPLFGSLNCTCQSGYYGQGCTNQIDRVLPETDYASGISIMIAPFCESMDVSYMLIAIEKPGKDLEVEFDNGMGLTNIQNINAAKVGNVSKLCIDCIVAPFRLCQFLKKDFKKYATVFLFEVIYPINKQQDENLIKNFTHLKYTEGRKYEIGVKVRNNLNISEWNPEQFSHTYQKIIWYKNQKGQSCLPLLHISHCSIDGKNIPPVYRPGTMKFEATIKPGLPNCRYSKFRLRWQIWQNIPNFDESDVPLRYFRFADDVHSYTLKPFELPENKYVIKLVGEMTINEHKRLFNFMYCFFNVELLNLVAVIDGGHTRSAHFKNDIILDVSKSFDPNEPMDRQTGLSFSWSCEPMIHDPVCDGTKRTDRNYVIHGPFLPGQAYTLTLTVSTYNKSEKFNGKATQTIQMVEAEIGALIIRCWKNCGFRGFNSTTHEIVYLETVYQGGSSLNPAVKLKWTYNNGSTSKPEDITAVRQPETPDHILIVDEEKMSKSAFYKFTVHGHNEEMAEYNIFTSSDPTPGSCSIDPKEGVMGVTKFKIVCFDFVSHQKDRILYYEFYDNKPGQPGLGVYMGATINGKLKDVTLVGGVITIHVMDTLRMFVRESVTATITNHIFEQFEISSMINNLLQYEKERNKIALMRVIAVLAETAIYTQNKEEEMLESLDAINWIQGTDDNTLKLLGSGLSNYLQVMLANEESGLGSHSTQIAGYIMKYIGTGFISLYRNLLKEENEIESRSIRQIAMYLAECAESLFKTKNETIRNYSVLTAEQEKIVTQYKEGFLSMVRALDMAAESGGFNLMPYQRVFSTVSSTISIWARLSAETKEMAKFIEGKPYLDVRLSQELAEEVDTRPGSLILEVVTMKKNPFWWYGGCYNVVESTSASIKLRKKHRLTTKLIRKLKHPIGIYLNLSSIETKPVTATTYLPSSEDDVENKNVAVTIHRIEAPVAAKLFLEFYNVSEPLKVVVLKNMIPDYEYMEELGIQITEDKHVYDVQDMLTNSDSFFYLGVLPGDPSIEELKNISYSFAVTTANCMTWHITILSRRCEAVLDSTLERLHCSCGHLSIITGSKISAPSLVNRDSDLLFSRKLETNIPLFIFIIILFLLFLIILLWAMCQERKDRFKELVVLLDDNYPGDDFGYLIAVYTGSRILAGTNANVGVRLFGKIHKSRAHILRSSKRKTMQRYDDDWFLLFTPHHLGQLHHIHVWHDNTGSFPDWFCDKIVVYDLEAQVEYIFPINQWLAAGINYYLEEYMAPVQKKDLDTQSNLTLENTVLGFRETHVWASIVNRHPRTTMTRIDRAAVCMCFVMLSLLITAVYYYVFEDPEDDPSFRVSIKDLFVGIASGLIIAAVIYLILLLFRFCGAKKENKPEKNQVQFEEKKVQFTENNISTGRYERRYSKIKAIRNVAKNVDPSIDSEKGNKKKQNRICFKFNQLRPVWLAPLNGSEEEKQIKTSRNIIPCLTCQAVIVICAIAVIILGMKLGKFKTEKWLMIAGFVIFEDIFIFLPLKILISAFLLGYYSRIHHGIKKASFQLNWFQVPQFSKWLEKVPNDTYSARCKLCLKTFSLSNMGRRAKLFYVDTYDFNYEEAKRKHLIGDNDYLFDLEKLRTKPMYHPLSRMDVTILRAKRLRRYSWRSFLELIIIVLFFIIVFLMMNDMYTARFYHTNNQIEKVLIQRTVKGTLSFEDVVSEKRLFDFLAFSFFPNIYTGLDNNNELKSDFETTKFGHTGWFVDDVHRLVGIPRLRQMRVLKDECKVPAVMRKADIRLGCLPSLNSLTEETRNYKFAWNENSWSELDSDKEPPPSPWVYVTPENSKSSTFYGKSGKRYHGGGYIVNLGRTKRETNYTLAETLYSNWIDQNTRVIIVELQLYAVNSDTYSLVSLLVELIPGAVILRRAEVLTVHDQRVWFYWTFIFLVFTAFFLWSNIYTLNEEGVMNFITHFWDYFEIITLLLCFINLGLHIYHIFYIGNTIQAYQTVGKDGFFSYAVLLKELRTIVVFSFFLFVCLTIRLLKTLKFGRRIDDFYYTFQFTARSVCCITIVYIMFLLSISTLISYILNSPFINTYGLYLMFKTGYRNLLDGSVFPLKRIILVIYCLSASFFSCVFVILYSYFIRIAKSHKLLKPELLNYFTFLKEELGFTDKNKRESITRRLRGGMDAPTPQLSKSNEMIMSLRTKQYIRYLISQNENTNKGYLQAIHFFKELPLEFSFEYEKLIGEFLKYEKNRNQYFKFISNFNFNLTCVVSKIDDILSDERE